VLPDPDLVEAHMVGVQDGLKVFFENGREVPPHRVHRHHEDSEFHGVPSSFENAASAAQRLARPCGAARQQIGAIRREDERGAA
jgi:hypothetical protein